MSIIQSNNESNQGKIEFLYLALIIRDVSTAVRDQFPLYVHCLSNGVKNSCLQTNLFRVGLQFAVGIVDYVAFPVNMMCGSYCVILGRKLH